MQALQLRDTFGMGLYFVVVGRVHRWLWLLLCLLHDDGIVISMMLLMMKTSDYNFIIIREWVWTRMRSNSWNDA